MLTSLYCKIRFYCELGQLRLATGAKAPDKGKMIDDAKGCA